MIQLLGLVVIFAIAVGIFYAWCGYAAKFGRDRARDTDAAATFEQAFIPDSLEVAEAEADLPELRDLLADAERVVLSEEMVAELDTAIAHVEGGWVS